MFNTLSVLKIHATIRYFCVIIELITLQFLATIDLITVYLGKLKIFVEILQLITKLLITERIGIPEIYIVESFPNNKKKVLPWLYSMSTKS